MKKIEKILIMGGGLMGKNIAFVASSAADCDITIYDINEVDVSAGIRQSTKQLVEKGIVSETELEERLRSFSQSDEGKEGRRNIPGAIQPI